ncbi:MAG: transposase [Terracidiphilus sp.]
MQFHPHAHCILAAGGLSPDHTRWISSSRRFFLPIKVLSRVFRGKFVAGLKNAFHAGTLQFHGSLLHLAEPRTFASWLRTLFRQDWVVYAKRPFGGPQHALRYLGAYTHRLAWPHRKVLDAIVPCRTGPLGGHRDQCVQRFRRDLRWAFPWPRTLSRPARLRV